MSEIARIDPSAPYFAALLVDRSGDGSRAEALFSAALKAESSAVRRAAAEALVARYLAPSDADSGDRRGKAVEIARARFDAGIGVIDLFFDAKLAATKSDARRLVEQGGAVVAEKNISDVKAIISADVLDRDGEVILRAGKKKFSRVIAK